MKSFFNFILEMNITDLGDGFTVHHHDLGDGHSAMVMFQKTGNNVTVDYTIHTPEKPEGTTEIGHLPPSKSVSTIMKVRKSIKQHLEQNPETEHITMHGTTDRQRESYTTIGKRLGTIKPVGPHGIQVKIKDNKEFK